MAVVKKRKEVLYKVSPQARVALVVARYHEDIACKLEQSCRQELTRHGVKPANIKTFETYGAFEIPFVCRKIADSADAIIALGAVIKGETPHFEMIAKAASLGIMEVSLHSKIPIIFGVLTPLNKKQALDRCGGKAGDKGVEAARAALQILSLNI